MIPFVHAGFQKASTLIGASPDELKLIFCLLLSYPLAGLLKRVPDATPGHKNLFAIGVSLFYLVGIFDLWDGLYTVLLSAGGAYAIAFFLRDSPYMPWIGFAFTMGHMSVSHISRQMANSPSTIDITGTQMVLVMKISAFCWNVADGQLPEDMLSDLQKSRRLKELPSLLDYAGYVFFFPGLLAGPSFDFTEYRAWLDTTMFDVPANMDPAKKPPVRKKRKIPRSGTPATIKSVIGLVWIGLFVKFAPLFDNSELTSPSYPTYGLLHRIWIMYMVSFVARFKYYGVWSLTEGACILTGLGYNGVDPVTGKASWNRLQNIDPWMVETAQNPRGFLAGWNMNTNNWLRNYVYLRVTPRGKKPGFRASLITFATSALWHGFHPGYYLSFILASLVQTAAKNFRRHVRPFFLDPVTGHPLPTKKYYDVLTWLVTQLTFSFTTIPFLVLSLGGSLWAWSQVYNYALIWTIGALGFFASPGKAMVKKQLEKRTGKASARLVRSVSTESITGKEPILGISKDPERDINEAIEEIRSEIEARESKKAS
ncbi:Lysophospholipid acyltransferase [Paramyrothecium foliicola]|nr:Lysophospholipid acyltransferase [Paramyrothecium foliicola]